MRLEIRLYAGLAERAGSRELSLELPENLREVGEIKGWLAGRHPEWGPLEHVRGVVGAAYVPDTRVLEPGDVLHLLPPVSGGAPAEAGGILGAGSLEAGVFELRAAALEPGQAQTRLAHPAFGGLAVFTGHTRDHSRGRRVLYLEYEALDEMTGPEMGRIFAEARERFGPAGRGEPARALRMLVQHRVGRVAPAEPSVLVGVASPHREAAFSVCRFLIDSLKERLPVWKKECYEDGHHWVGDRS